MVISDYLFSQVVVKDYEWIECRILIKIDILNKGATFITISPKNIRREKQKFEY